MNSEALFGMALNLPSPWQVDGIDFKPGAAGHDELHIRVGFVRGSRFADQSGEPCAVHDTVERSWQHLNFFEHPCYLHCRVPRIKTRTGKVETVAVPWACPGSGFTPLFEALAMSLIEREMPVNRVAEMLRANPQRIWTLFNHWVCDGLKRDDPSGITKLGVDETSTRKGHNYITVGVDLDAKRVIHVTEGKGKKTLDAIQKHLSSHEVKPGQITDYPPPSLPGQANPSQRRKSPSTTFTSPNCSTKRWTRYANRNARNTPTSKATSTLS